jgi:hypothetical protein
VPDTRRHGALVMSSQNVCDLVSTSKVDTTDMDNMRENTHDFHRTIPR